MAQESNEDGPIGQKTLSKAEEYYTRSGKIIETQFHTLGTIRNVNIKMLQIFDHAEHVELRAIKLDMQTEGQFSRYRAAIIDKDEVDDLLTALKLMRDKIYPTTRNTYTEVSYNSRSGFEVGCYFEPSKMKCCLNMALTRSSNFKGTVWETNQHSSRCKQSAAAGQWRKPQQQLTNSRCASCRNAVTSACRSRLSTRDAARWHAPRPPSTRTSRATCPPWRCRPGR